MTITARYKDRPDTPGSIYIFTYEDDEAVEALINWVLRYKYTIAVEDGRIVMRNSKLDSWWILEVS